MARPGKNVQVLSLTLESLVVYQHKKDRSGSSAILIGAEKYSRNHRAYIVKTPTDTIVKYKTQHFIDGLKVRPLDVSIPDSKDDVLKDMSNYFENLLNDKCEEAHRSINVGRC
ncbi:hypothetical protein HELRODRAFT_165009 [Helobdella robusta]|uniref:Uncharacterized protein n=1 Tax=Helobdella robusta TaxID=6412 RepID=T1EW44_HELRO|nr:hypothetical protein HELRODRAFT_165009 [Helobdella robusta]ESN92876.1 hypothetical protein HELRODRAFT_165009 [Helobdella robusta]